MMLKMDFDEKWVRWITMYLETISYSITVNSKKVGLIILGKGLRQGDPLSPYLVIICVEGLTTLVKTTES